MRGMDASTGRAIDGLAHLAQSIGDILTTPLNSRVMRRDYGSLLFELIDQPITPRTLLRLYAATAVALMRWEPRIKLRKVSVLSADAGGAAALLIDGVRTDTPAPDAVTRLTIPLRAGVSPALATA